MAPLKTQPSISNDNVVQQVGGVGVLDGAPIARRRDGSGSIRVRVPAVEIVLARGCGARPRFESEERATSQST